MTDGGERATAGGRRGRGRAGHLVPLGVALLLAGAACVGCVTPPALLPAGDGTIALAEYPPGSELLELPVAEGGEVLDGTALRGVFVPADPGAPVVLHLLESGGSVTGETFTWVTGPGSYSTVLPRVRDVYQRFVDAGFASVAVDYEGVGASDGERSPEHLARDALTAWREAVRRAGDPSRVVVRGTSIGTLAAAQLLHAGEEPAALLLASPVLADTVVERFGDVVHGPFLTALASPFLADPVEVDLDEALAAHPLPVEVWLLDGDELLPPEDAARVRRAVEAAGGTFHAMDGYRETVELPDFIKLRRHLRGALAARELLPGEADALRALFPDAVRAEWRVARVLDALPADVRAQVAPGTPAGERLARHASARLHDEPLVLAAVVLADNSPDDDVAFLESFRPPYGASWHRGLPLDELVRRIDLDDPAGDLPFGPLGSLASRFVTVEAHPAGLPSRPPLDDLLAALRGAGRDDVESRRYLMTRIRDGSRGSSTVDLRRQLWDGAAEGAPTEADAARRAVRLLMKAAGYPERVVEAPDGRLLVEVDDGGVARRVDPALVFEPPEIDVVETEWDLR